MPVASELLVKIAADTSNLESGLSSADNKVKSFASGAGALGTVAGVAFTAIGAAAIGVVGGIGAAVNTAANFESAMSAVGAVAVASKEELAGLSQTALNLGMDTTLAGVSATDAAAAMQELASGGVSVADIMGGGAYGALQLASAGGGDVSRAAEIASLALKDFGLSGAQLPHVADLFAAAANTSAVTVDDLGQSLKFVGPVANSMGISIEELTGTLAELGDKGITASTAGTSLRGMITNLAAPTKQQTAVMQELGLSFFDSSGHMKNLAGISQELHDKLGGLTDQQRTAALSIMFGNEGLTAAQILYDGGAAAVENYTNQVNVAGSAAANGAARNDNLKGALAGLGGVWETLTISVGQAFIPAIRGATEGLTGFLTNIMPIVTSAMPGIVAGLESVIGAAVRFGSGVVSAVQAVVGAFQAFTSGQINFSQLIGGLETFIGTLTGRLGGLAAQAAPYIGQFFSAIGSAINTYGPQVVAQFAIWGGRFSEWIQTTAIPFLVPRLQAFGAAITSWITGTALPAITAAAQALGQALGNWIQTTAIPFLQANLPVWMAALGTWITGTAVPFLVAQGTVLGQALGQWITTVAIPYLAANLPVWIAALGAGLANALNTIANFAATAGARLHDWLALPATQAMFAAWGGAIAGALNGIMAIVVGWGVQLHNAIGEQFSQLGTAIQGKLGEIGAAIGAAFSALGTAVQGQLAAAFGAVGATFSALGATIQGALDAIGGAVGATFSALGGTIQGALDAIGSAVGGTFSALGSTVQGALDGIRGIVQSVWDAIPEDIRADLEAIVSDVGDRFSAAGSAVSSAMSTIQSDVESGWSSITSAVGSAMSAVGSAVEAGWSAITAAVGSAMSSLGSAVESGWSAISSAVGAAMSTLGSTVESGWSAVTSAVTGAVATIYGAVSTAWGSIVAATEGAWSSFLATITGFLSQAIGAVQAFGGQVAGALASVAGAAAGEAAAIGGAIVQGLVGGIMAGAGAVASAAGDIVRGALGAARAALESKSPSRKFMEIGSDAVDGLVIGLTDNQVKATQAAAQMASAVAKAVQDTLGAMAALASYNFATGTPTGDQIGMFTGIATALVQSIQDAAADFNDKGEKAASAFADAAQKVGGMVKGALDGIQALASYNFAKGTPTGDQMGMLTTLVVSLVRSIQDAADGFDAAGEKAASDFADSAGKVLAMIKTGVDAFAALATFTAPPAANIYSFGKLLRAAINDLALIVEQVTQDAGAAAGKFATAIAPAITLLGNGVAAFDKLADFTAPPALAIYTFGKLLRAAINDLALIAEQVTAEAGDAAGKFATSVGPVVTLLGNGVGAFAKLADFQAVPSAAIYAFGKALRAAINDFALLSEQITAPATQAAAVFADGAGKVVTAIGNGVTAFEKLDTFSAPASTAIYSFGKAIRAVINDFALLAEQITGPAVKAAADFATGAGTALGVIKTGVDGLMGLNTFVAPSKQAIDNFLAAALYVVQRFGQMADTLNKEGIAQTTAFSLAAQAALTATKTGTDAFKAFEKLVVPSKQAIDNLVAGIVYVVTRLGEMATQIGTTGLQQAQAFATTAQTVFTSIKTAVDVMNTLAKEKGTVTATFDGMVSEMKDVLDRARDLAGQASATKASSEDYLRDMQQAAANFAKGMGMAVGGAAPALAKTASDAAKGVVTAAKDALGIASPSKEFQYIGEMTLAGLVQGLYAGTPLATAAMTTVATALKDTVIGQLQIATVSDVMVRYGEAIMHGLDMGMTLAGASVIDTASRIVSAVTDQFSGMLTELGALNTKMGGWLTTITGALATARDSATVERLTTIAEWLKSQIANNKQSITDTTLAELEAYIKASGAAGLDVPKLAAGGLVTSPTLALIGERGPEAVIPLSQLGNTGGGGGIVLNVTVAGNIYGVDQMQDVVVQAVTTAKRRGRL